MKRSATKASKEISLVFYCDLSAVRADLAKFMDEVKRTPIKLPPFPVAKVRKRKIGRNAKLAHRDRKKVG